jgi:hypothetical protein
MYASDRDAYIDHVEDSGEASKGDFYLRSLLDGNSPTTFLRYLGASNELAIMEGGGQVGIGTSAPDSHLHVAGGDIRITGNNTVTLGTSNEGLEINTSIQALGGRFYGPENNDWIEITGNERIEFYTQSTLRMFLDNNGNARATGELEAFDSSDRRKKNHLTPIRNARQKLRDLKGYRFHWNSNARSDKVGDWAYGVVAQEIKQHLPHAVRVNADGYLAIRSAMLHGFHVAVLREHEAELIRQRRKDDELEERIETLEQENQSLRSQLRTLKND